MRSWTLIAVVGLGVGGCGGSSQPSVPAAREAQHQLVGVSDPGIGHIARARCYTSRDHCEVTAEKGASYDCAVGFRAGRLAGIYCTFLTPALQLEATRICLRSAGFHVVGGPVGRTARGDSAAVGELVTSGSFIAFYPSAAVAARAAPAITRNQTRLRIGGSLVQRGNITILFVGTSLPEPTRGRIISCAQ